MPRMSQSVYNIWNGSFADYKFRGALMSPDLIYIVALAVLAIAVGVLWWQHLRLRQTYRVFFDNSQPKSLQRELVTYAKDVDEALHKLDQLAGFTAKMHSKSLKAISKIGLIRFNPFGDTGGDQSFCLVLLDSNDSGLAISSIHARSGTRFYAKQINEGKPLHPLSDEEQAAFKKAVETK